MSNARKLTLRSFAVRGPKGDKGDTGATGKTAYASAQDGGYAGSEADFNAGLAGINGYVSFKETQSLDSTEKGKARSNISAPADEDAVIEGSIKINETGVNAVSMTVDSASTQDILDLEGTLGTKKVQISGVADPSSAYDAANKQYVDLKAPIVVTIEPDVHETGYESSLPREKIVSALENNRDVCVAFTPISSVLVYFGTFSLNTTSDAAFSYIFIPAATGSLASARFYYINIADNNGNDEITVTENECRLVPKSTLSNAGNVLAVGSTGIPEWKTSRNRVVFTASQNGNTITVTASSMTYSEVLAAINAGIFVDAELDIAGSHYYLPLEREITPHIDFLSASYQVIMKSDGTITAAATT